MCLRERARQTDRHRGTPASPGTVERKTWSKGPGGKAQLGLMAPPCLCPEAGRCFLPSPNLSQVTENTWSLPRSFPCGGFTEAPPSIGSRRQGCQSLAFVRTSRGQWPRSNSRAEQPQGLRCLLSPPARTPYGRGNRLLGPADTTSHQSGEEVSREKQKPSVTML